MWQPKEFISKHIGNDSGGHIVDFHMETSRDFFGNP